MMLWYGNDGSSYLPMIFGMLVFWGLIVAGAILLIRQPDRRARAAGGMVPAHRTAQQILAERFARGEIDESEFTARLAALHGTEAAVTVAR
jgi:putative membrane protein